jgi:hypothetical protein
VINVKRGGLEVDALGLVIPVVEAVQGTLKARAFKVMESGLLDSERRERLGRALLELETALEDVKKDPGIARSVPAVGDGLKGIIDDMVGKILHP